jgi:predicted RNA-binding Zn ribbon-like protein
MSGTATHANDLKLIGGWLCLDFINTVGCRNSKHPYEWLTKYSDLVSWSQHAGTLTENEAQGLLRRAELHHTDAKAVLERATILRETLHRVFSAIINHQLSNPSDITTFNVELSNAMAQTRLLQTADTHNWSYVFKDNAHDRMLWSVVRSAADLLTSNKLDRIRRCSGENWATLQTRTRATLTRKKGFAGDFGTRCNYKSHMSAMHK